MPLWTLLSMPPWPLATLSGHNSIASPLLLPYLFPLWKNAIQSSGAQLSASRLLTSKTKNKKEDAEILRSQARHWLLAFPVHRRNFVL
jgi:hypothetical protein